MGRQSRSVAALAAPVPGHPAGVGGRSPGVVAEPGGGPLGAGRWMGQGAELQQHPTERPRRGSCSFCSGCHMRGKGGGGLPER
eukprot:161457-Chlamydomonas_euryale.AAC.1